MANDNLQNLNQRQQNNLKRKKKRKLIGFVVLFLCIVGTAVTWAFAARLMDAQNNIHKKVDTVNLRDKDISLSKDSFSVLLLGIDNGAYGRATDSGRSDTMLLVTVNEKLGKTTIVSIPRDSYTEIVGKGIQDKINHAYAYGQEQMSINSVQNMLNIPIDYYVTVDMGGLMGIVNAIGGLEITPALTFTYEGESFTEGETRHVDGEAALRYARMRYDDPEGDFGRQKRQQYVIQKMVEKLLTLGSITKYESILKSLENSVRTNFTIADLMLIKDHYPTALHNFQRESITGEGVMIDGVYYYSVAEVERIRISNILRETLNLPKIETLQHIETKEIQTNTTVNENSVRQLQQTNDYQNVNEVETEPEYVEPSYYNPTPSYQGNTSNQVETNTNNQNSENTTSTSSSSQTNVNKNTNTTNSSAETETSRDSGQTESTPKVPTAPANESTNKTEVSSSSSNP